MKYSLGMVLVPVLLLFTCKRKVSNLSQCGPWAVHKVIIGSKEKSALRWIRIIQSWSNLDWHKLKMVTQLLTTSWSGTAIAQLFPPTLASPMVTRRQHQRWHRKCEFNTIASFSLLSVFLWCIRTTPPRATSPYDCDFETDNCSSWKIISKPEVSWTRVQGLVAAQVDNHNSLYDHTGNQAQGYYLLLQPNASASSSNVRKCEERGADIAHAVSLFAEQCIESIAQFDNDQQSSMSRILVLHVRSKCRYPECAKSVRCLVSCTAMDQHWWKRLRMVPCTS